MGFYRDLNPATPVGSDQIAQGDDELRAIKQALHDQWPNFTPAAANPSIAELNTLVGVDTSETLRTQLDYLLARTSLLPLPASARNFLDPWWFTTGSENQHRYYTDYATYDDYSNVPWPWGSQLTTQPERDRKIVLLVQRYVNNTQNIALNVVIRMAENLNWPGDWDTQEFKRGADNATNMQNSSWWRNTAARINHIAGAGGDVVYTTVCPEKAAQCP